MLHQRSHSLGVDEYEVAVHVPVHHGSSERGQKIRTPASVASEALLRARWLCALLVLQSLSGSVLAAFERLIRKHLVVTLFLTMVRACRLQIERGVVSSRLVSSRLVSSGWLK